MAAPPPPTYDPYGGYHVPHMPMPTPSPVPAPGSYLPVQVKLAILVCYSKIIRSLSAVITIFYYFYKVFFSLFNLLLHLFVTFWVESFLQIFTVVTWS